jgi:hypothetical protein
MRLQWFWCMTASVSLSGIEFAQSLRVAVLEKFIAHESRLARRSIMRSSKCIETESVKVSDAKRLSELQSENDLLKLLYTDLLAKTVVIRGCLARGMRDC